MLSNDEIKKDLKNAEYKVDGVVTRGFYLDYETINHILDLINQYEMGVE